MQLLVTDRMPSVKKDKVMINYFLNDSKSSSLEHFRLLR